MVYKKNSPASERLIFLNNILLTFKNIPLELIKEAEEFSKRNGLVVVAYNIKSKKPIYRCCERCLKAYLIKKFGERKLNITLLKFINEALDCETGHNGYYLDGNRVVEI